MFAPGFWTLKSGCDSDEDCGPSRECFHVDVGGPGEGNHLGMPENGDPLGLRLALTSFES
jgi:hypothetical protein